MKTKCSFFSMKCKCIIISLLVIVIMYNTDPQVLATSIKDSEYQDRKVDELPKVFLGNDVLSLKHYDIDTQYDDIKKSEDNFYAMLIETEDGRIPVPVGKVEINLADEKDIQMMIADNRITKEIKMRLIERHQQAIEQGITDEKAVLFSTELLRSKTGSDTQSTTTSTYYTYKNTRMRSDRVVYNGINTGYKTIKTGKKTKITADSITDIAIAAASFNKYVSFFSSGISLFKAFNDAFGTTWATGSTQDHLYVRLIYNKIDQWTYMQIGNEWHLGLCAQKATVTNIASEQYYYNSEKRQGKTKTQSRIVNTVHKSPHFDSPWATAYQGYYNPLTEWMTWKCGSITFTF